MTSGEHLSQLVNYGVDIHSRQILLVGEVDADLYLRTIVGLIVLNQISNEPITVVINTHGGEVAQAFAIIEAIRESQAPVDTLAVGACMSAGVLILQAGSVRNATFGCSIMAHFGEETNSSGSEAKHNAELTKRMKRLIQERTQRSLKTVNKWLEADTYFTAQEALKQGLIDIVIGGPK